MDQQINSNYSDITQVELSYKFVTQETRKQNLYAYIRNEIGEFDEPYLRYIYICIIPAVYIAVDDTAAQTTGKITFKLVFGSVRMGNDLTKGHIYLL